MLLMINSNLNVVELLKAASALPTKLDTTGVLMAFGQGKGIPVQGPLRTAAEEIGSLRGSEPLHLMINTIPPGIVVPKHVDQLPDFIRSDHHHVRFPHLERWHLPLASGSKSWWWDEENGFCYMLPGRWYGPVQYWKKHSVGNDGNEDRIHLIVDLAKEV